MFLGVGEVKTILASCSYSIFLHLILISVLHIVALSFENDIFQISMLPTFTFNAAHLTINTAQKVQYCTVN